MPLFSVYHLCCMRFQKNGRTIFKVWICWSFRQSVGKERKANQRNTFKEDVRETNCRSNEWQLRAQRSKLAHTCANTIIDPVRGGEVWGRPLENCFKKAGPADPLRTQNRSFPDSLTSAWGWRVKGLHHTTWTHTSRFQGFPTISKFCMTIIQPIIRYLKKLLFTKWFAPLARQFGKTRL